MIDLIAGGELEILASTTTFQEIPDAVERLQAGDVTGRIVAVMD